MTLILFTIGGFFDQDRFEGEDWGQMMNSRQRINLFRKRGKSPNDVSVAKADFKNTPTPFVGCLQFETNSAGAGVPCGVKIKIDLRLSSDAFFIQTPTKPIEKYKFQVRSASLHVPVGVMNPLKWQRESSSLTNQHRMQFNYRNVHMLERAIPEGTGRIEFRDLQRKGSVIPV